jgi:hypothetical protein
VHRHALLAASDERHDRSATGLPSIQHGSTTLGLARELPDRSASGHLDGSIAGALDGIPLHVCGLQYVIAMKRAA